MIAYSFLLGFLPFVNFFRFNPVPSFWVQWVEFFVALIFTLHVLWLRRGKQNRHAEVAVLSLCLVGLSLILLGQIYFEVAYSRINAIFGIFVLLIGASLHQAVKVGFDPVEKTRLLDWWARGVGVAFACQICASLLLWCGKTLVPFQVVDVVPPLRMYGTFGQPNQFGVFLVLALSAITYMARKEIIGRPLFLLGWLASAVLCAASGSRAALCIWVIFAAGQFVQEIRRIKPVDLPYFTYGWRILGMHVFFGIIQFLWGMGWIYTSNRREAAASRVLNDVGPIVARLEQYRDSFALFVDRPFFGYGFENFASSRFYYLSSSLLEPEATHTHNLLTNALVEFGLLGFSVVLIGVVWVVWAALKAFFNINGKDECSSLVGVWALGLFGYSLLEYPFNYVNFFYVFLFTSAFLPGRGVILGMEKIGVIKRVRALVLLSALLMSILVAVDYRRVQVMVLDLEAQAGRQGKVTNLPSLEYLTRLRQQSFFVRHVDYYWMKSLGISGDVPEMKIAVAKDLFENIPSVETLSWYAVHLISGGRGGEALPLLCNFGMRNAPLFDLTMDRMRHFAGLYAPIADFLTANQEQLSRRCR